MSYPWLYTCSVCEAPVKVKPVGLGEEPEKVFSCDHTDAVIWANRKVTLRGKSELSHVQKVTLTIRQLLSMLTGRSI